jgi:hypothetical protein
MAEVSVGTAASRSEQLDQMHALYRQGGQERQTVPHIVYPQGSCPHEDCDQPMQAIGFRLKDHGRAIHDPLVRAWWDDTGFAGRCPRCGGWIQFTIRAQRAITEKETAGYPQLPDDWHAKATIV